MVGVRSSLYLLQTIPYLSHRWVTDESWYAATGYSIANGNGIANPAMGPNDLENRLDARPPGTAIVIAAAFRLFGTDQIAARLGSILAGLTIIFLTYRLARDLIGQEGALVAAFLLAPNNLTILTSRSARPKALTAMAIFASLLAMKKYARATPSLGLSSGYSSRWELCSMSRCWDTSFPSESCRLFWIAGTGNSHCGAPSPIRSDTALA